MSPGHYVVVRGRLCVVVALTETGEVLLADEATGDEQWADYFAVRIIDPNADPSQVLEAMATIFRKEKDDAQIQDSACDPDTIDL